MRRAPVLPVVFTVVVLFASTSCGRANRDRVGGATTSSTSAPSSSAGASSTTTTRDPSPPDGGPVRAAVEPVGAVADRSLKTPDGRTRTYHVYVPRDLPDGADVPLLVALHGGFGNGNQFRRTSGFDGLAEANGFIVVFPDGTSIKALKDSRVWNAGACCGAAVDGKDAVDDVGFLAAMVDDLADELPIDRDRVFFAGHSNGAMMSYRMACDRADLVRGIGVQSGALMTSSCIPSASVSVLHIHGTADHNVPIDGGVGDSSISRTTYPDPKAATATFADLDGCHQPPSEAVDADNPDVTSRTWTGCGDHSIVRFTAVSGANHAWMGHPSPSTLSTRRSGEPYQSYDSSLAIWTFLAAVPAR